MDHLEKPLLISLIFVLGLILYMKLIRGLKNRRLSQEYLSIDGYDLVRSNVISVKYSSHEKIDAQFIFSNENSVLKNEHVYHETGGNFQYELDISEVNDPYLKLEIQTERQKIVKKLLIERLKSELKN